MAMPMPMAMTTESTGGNRKMGKGTCEGGYVTRSSKGKCVCHLKEALQHLVNVHEEGARGMTVEAVTRGTAGACRT